MPHFTQAGQLAALGAPRPVGIQLFTLFRQMNEDPKATLQQTAAAGYKEVESAFFTRIAVVEPQPG